MTAADRAWLGPAWQAWQGTVRQGRARPGVAWQRVAVVPWQGVAWHVSARQARVRQALAGLGWARHWQSWLNPTTK